MRIIVALALGLALMPTVAFAQLVNQTIDGRVITTGDYWNTPGGKTTFTNSQGTGLLLERGSWINGREGAVQNLPGWGGPRFSATGAGGHVHMDVPGQVVRLEGNVNLQGLNGGALTIDAAYLFQNGNIYAGGVNRGGTVSMNVGAATINGTIDVQGPGGRISINSPGSVDIQGKGLLQADGSSAFSPAPGLIEIQGGLVNVDGIIRANGNLYDGNVIRLVSNGGTDTAAASNAIAAARDGGSFTADEAAAHNARLGALAERDGDIHVGPAKPEGGLPGVLEANGRSGPAVLNEHADISDNDARPTDGGTIILRSQNDIVNRGWITADGGALSTHSTDKPFAVSGGNGGTVGLSAGGRVVNDGRIKSDGGSATGPRIRWPFELNGGDGGVVTLTSGLDTQNNAVIRANGGHGRIAGTPTGIRGRGGDGGIVLFNGENPTGTGIAAAQPGLGGPSYLGVLDGPAGRAGSIILANPATTSNQLLGIWRRSNPIELISHGRNLLLLTGPGRPATGSAQDWAAMAPLRTVKAQAGTLPQNTTSLNEQDFKAKSRPDGEVPPDRTYFYDNFVHHDTASEGGVFDPASVKR